MFDMKPIPKDNARGWTVTIDGEERSGIGLIELSSRFGTLTYGLRPEGYDAWAFREEGGGGVVTIPYTIDPNGNVFVGLIQEKRTNMGSEPVLCVIGGFVDPDETHDSAQIRETAEESGLDARKSQHLDGAGANPNRAFFVADAMKGEGEGVPPPHCLQLAQALRRWLHAA